MNLGQQMKWKDQKENLENLEKILREKKMMKKTEILDKTASSIEY